MTPLPNTASSESQDNIDASTTGSNTFRQQNEDGHTYVVVEVMVIVEVVVVVVMVFFLLRDPTIMGCGRGGNGIGGCRGCGVVKPLTESRSGRAQSL